MIACLALCSCLSEVDLSPDGFACDTDADCGSAPCVVGICNGVAAMMISLSNPGFELDFSDWSETEPAAISTSDFYDGAQSAKLSSPLGGCSQRVTGIAPQTTYRLSAWGLGRGLIGIRAGNGEETTAAIGDVTWSSAHVTFTASALDDEIEIFSRWASGDDFRVDDFSLSALP